MSQISQLSKLAISIAVTQQSNHVVWHIIVWLVGVVPFSTNRKGEVTRFFLLANTSCLQTLSWEEPVFIVSSCTKRAANMKAMLAKKRGSALLLCHLKSVTWFGCSGASVDLGGIKRLAYLMLLTCSDCVSFVITPWFCASTAVKRATQLSPFIICLFLVNISDFVVLLFLRQDAHPAVLPSWLPVSLDLLHEHLTWLQPVSASLQWTTRQYEVEVRS